MYGETKRDLVEIIKKLCEMKQVQLIDVPHLIKPFDEPSGRKEF